MGHFFPVVNLDAGSYLAEQGKGILEVGHAGPYNDGFGMGCRFQNVVAPMLDQAAAYKYGISYGVDPAQFPNGVNEHHIVGRAAAGRQFLQFGTEPQLQAVLLGQLGNLMDTAGFPGRHNQPGVGEFLLDILKTLKEGFFFGRMGAAGYNHRVIAAQSQFFLILGQILRSHLRIGLVELGVAGDKNPAFFSPQVLDVLGINGRLHTETGNAAHHVGQNAKQVPVAFDGLVGNPAVDHHHRNPAELHGPQEVGPQFRFHRHENPGHNAFYKGFGHKGQIQGEVDDGIGFRNNLVGHVVAPGGHGGHQDFGVGHGLANFFHQRAGSYDFAHGSPVDPDTVFMGYGGNLVIPNQADALPEAAGKAFFPEIPPGKVRQDYDDK